ncbi:MAG: hypothetical protein ACOH19_16925 [Rhodoglobus sp.]
MIDTGTRLCAFCGSPGPLTREHVFGNWLSKIGLDNDPVEHFAGPLNRIPRPMGVGTPFRQTVKNVCAECNNGWMGNLEEIAKRVLTPLILGESGRISADDQSAIAMWLQKTALVSMLLSSASDREQGYGLPPSEYAALYAQRAALAPLQSSMFWAGRYEGELRLGSAWVTPLAVGVEGLPDTELPHGYAMTIALGSLVLHGVRFTHLPFIIDIASHGSLQQLWPLEGNLELTEPAFGDDRYLSLARGQEFRTPEPEVSLLPWRPASDLDQSELVGAVIELPLLCGKHVAYYPADLVHEAQRGRFYWFMTSCECGKAYLIHTESNGAHAKAADIPERIEAEYEAIVGTEFELESLDGGFVVKRDEA